MQSCTSLHQNDNCVATKSLHTQYVEAVNFLCCFSHTKWWGSQCVVPNYGVLKVTQEQVSV